MAQKAKSTDGNVRASRPSPRCETAGWRASGRVCGQSGLGTVRNERRVRAGKCWRSRSGDDSNHSSAADAAWSQFYVANRTHGQPRHVCATREPTSKGRLVPVLECLLTLAAVE